MTTPVVYIDRDEAVEIAAEAADRNTIEELRRQIIEIQLDLDKRQSERQAIQESLAGITAVPSA